ncbi:polysaccharide deacetylase family protein [Christiangramia echinicola]|uniref:Polysaccharide deacetylase n=1 Tax=Christiangramia echinicola TaxID=279359 RepID=A0A1H1L450_9FLAO|nr:polysaccharide deacetylase family protein [Christiangramia echinicola]SDR69338.1 Polysaccharide deacetylase [Christiangramia echinicola]
MLIIANYHYLREDFSAPFPSIYGVTPAQFENQLKKLSKFGKFISQDELLEKPEKIEADNYFLITFDDGLKEQYELAKPILDKLGIPYIFFINTANFANQEVSLVHKVHLLRSKIAPEKLLGQIENKSLNSEEKKAAIVHYNYDSPENAILKYILNFKFNHIEQENFIEPIFDELFEEANLVKDLYFSDAMLLELAKKNVLGSHSHSHRPLGLLSKSEAEEELRFTQEFFRKRFGTTARSISYPYGSFNACEGITSLVKKAGFQIGFSMERAANESLDTDRLLLSRFDCNDLPGGKNDLFNGKNPFESAPIRKWNSYENSTINK